MHESERYALLLLEQQGYVLKALETVYLQLKGSFENKEILAVFKEKYIQNIDKKFELSINVPVEQDGKLIDNKTVVLKTRSLEKVLLYILEHEHLSSEEDAVEHAVKNSREVFLSYDKLTYDEKVRICAAERRCISQLKDELTVQMAKDIFSMNPEAKWAAFPSGFIPQLSDEEILELTEISPALMWELHYRINSKELLYDLLQILVKKKYPYKIGYFGERHSHLVSQPLQDKVYFQALCMLDGYNYRFIPKEYVSEKLIHYTLDNSVEKNNLSHMYEVLEDKFKTAEITKKCIAYAPYCARFLPETLKNDDYYISLLEEGLYEFVTWLPDFKKLSKKVIMKWLEIYPKDKFFHSTVDIPYMKDIEVAKIALDINGINPESFKEELFKDREFCILFLQKKGYSKHIPKEMLTKEFWYKSSIEDPPTIRIIPKEYLGKELFCYLMDRRVWLTYIPEEYRTDEYLLAYAKEGLLDPTYIPESCKSKAVWLEVFKNAKNPKFKFPPAELQDEEICTAILKTYDRKGYNHYHCLNFLKYVSEDYQRVCVEESASALKNIRNPSRELIDYAIKCHPSAKLYAPEWYFNVDIPKVQPSEKKERSKEAELQMETLANSDFEQLSIFDLFKIA